MAYDEAAVSILKSMREPTLTLTSVEKPWMSSSPEPRMSHSLAGVPGLLFSQEILLPPAPHGSVAETAGLPPSTAHMPDRIATRAPSASTRRRPGCRVLAERELVTEYPFGTTARRSWFEQGDVRSRIASA